MKTWLIGALVLALAAPLMSTDAEAKRLGGGKSTGTQRNMTERTAPDASPAVAPSATPAPTPGTAPAQAVPAAAATPAAAAAGKRSWMGPLAGLAAGLGLAALASHLGFGEAFANAMLLMLAVVAVIALVAFIRRRAGVGSTPALAGAGAGGGSGAQVAWPTPDRGAASSAASGLQRSAEPALDAPRPATAGGAVFVPAAFDSESFERIAKAIFIRMQAANDARNLDDLRQFTTPEMFAEFQLEVLERGSAPQTTEVRRVDAKVLDVAEEAERQVVSVRYRGELVEEAGAAPVAFDEVWHLVRPRGSDGGWVIAGIEQMA